MREQLDPPMAEPSSPIPEQVRAACAWVAGRARSVRIEESAIAEYARGLAPASDAGPPDPETELLEGSRETRAAFAICLDAINFGSGWWPTIRKRPGLSGYSTVAAGVVERFHGEGPWWRRSCSGSMRQRSPRRSGRIPSTR